MISTRGCLPLLPLLGVALLLGSCSGQNEAVCKAGQATCGSEPSPNLNLVSPLKAVAGGNNCQPSGEPRLISDTTGLFNEIDGAAPRYIERGWVKSAYADYQCDGLRLTVAIHDMGSVENAMDLFSFSKTEAMVQLDSRTYAALNASLPNAYASLAHLGRYYYELSVSAQTPASLALITAMTIRLLDLSLGGH